MKKNIAIVAGGALLLSLAQTASAQGYLNLSTFNTSSGFFVGTTSTEASTATTFWEVLAGPTAGSLVGVVSGQSGQAINLLNFASSVANGVGFGTYADNGSGATTIPASTTGFFQVLAWQGGATYAQATEAFASAVWSQVVGTAPGVNPPTPPTPASLSISFATPVHGSVASLGSGAEGLILTPAVPEPTTLALAGLGGFGMLMAMRRKKA